MEINEKLRLIRLSKSLSQENVADLLKISHVAYGKIETAKTDVGLKRLKQICSVLGMTLKDLAMYGEPNEISIETQSLISELKEQSTGWKSLAAERQTELTRLRQEFEDYKKLHPSISTKKVK